MSVCAGLPLEARNFEPRPPRQNATPPRRLTRPLGVVHGLPVAVVFHSDLKSEDHRADEDHDHSCRDGCGDGEVLPGWRRHKLCPSPSGAAVRSARPLRGPRWRRAIGAICDVRWSRRGSHVILGLGFRSGLGYLETARQRSRRSLPLRRCTNPTPDTQQGRLGESRSLLGRPSRGPEYVPRRWLLGHGPPDQKGGGPVSEKVSISEDLTRMLFGFYRALRRERRQSLLAFGRAPDTFPPRSVGSCRFCAALIHLGLLSGEYAELLSVSKLQEFSQAIDSVDRRRFHWQLVFTRSSRAAEYAGSVYGFKLQKSRLGLQTEIPLAPRFSRRVGKIRSPGHPVDFSALGSSSGDAGKPSLAAPLISAARGASIQLQLGTGVCIFHLDTRLAARIISTEFPSRDFQHLQGYTELKEGPSPPLSALLVNGHTSSGELARRGRPANPRSSGSQESKGAGLRVEHPVAFDALGFRSLFILLNRSCRSRQCRAQFCSFRPKTIRIQPPCRNTILETSLGSLPLTRHGPCAITAREHSFSLETKMILNLDDKNAGPSTSGQIEASSVHRLLNVRCHNHD
ncbi:hypothetical protein B0H17DRAFT_1132758 [Mycena rosella]|uniref:Uncharacterized protein n=1 Tax=Mycena rosella TaxID=1033263 RepID=A0AAD7DJ97_MYCRO|nr:hypothetical protein B0H17DRAFT_1132758 [Mycena rosella]